MGIYYDGYQTLTYNALFNFIIGNRGSGKTYWAKRWAIKDFKKTGSQFIYLRRYKTELKTVKNFFNDIIDEFPDDTFSVKGNSFYVNGEKAGEVMCLSTSKILKSNSYPTVNKIIFDEFLIDKVVYKYLQGEVETFLDLYETIARMREVRVFFIANAISQTNPYFIYFNVELPYGKKIQTFYNDGKGRFQKQKNKDYPDVLIELVMNEEFIEVKSKQRFGQIIAGTRYGDYAINNDFLRDSTEFIKRKDEKCRYLYTVSYETRQIGVWTDAKNGLVYLSDDVDPNVRVKYAFTTDDHKINTLLISSISTSPSLKYLFNAFKVGAMRFETMDIKNIFMEILKHV